MKKGWMTVVSQRCIARHVYELVLEGELAHRFGIPGQFVHIKVQDAGVPLLRRPISICDVDAASGRATLIYRAEGQGTKLLSQKASGDRVDVLGPLGNGFPVSAADPGQTALLVGGGIGVPPLYYLSRELNRIGVGTIHAFGFASGEDVFYEERFRQLGSTFTATVDGSAGYHGLVTDVIREEEPAFDVLYACGPTGLLRVLDREYRSRKGFLSLEERMACGIGACYACVCKLQDEPEGNGYRKVCSDGPVFPIGEVLI